MITARSAIYAYLAIILTVAALLFPLNIRAASGNVQVCSPNSSCSVGEFLYDDSYTPITTASCIITSRYPNETLFLDPVAMTSSTENDGWYSKAFTAPATTGVYRTQVCCTPIGGDKLCLDKTFEVKDQSTLSSSDVAGAVWNADRSSFTASGTFGQALQNIVPGSGDVASAVWGYSSRTLTGFGTLVADIWANTTRTLTKDTTTTTTNITNIQNTTSETRDLLEQIINRPIIENEMEESSFTTTELQTKLEKSDSLANQLLTSGNYLKSKTNLLSHKWDSLGEGEITKSLGQFEAVIGKEDDLSDKNSTFGSINWISQQWDLPISSKLYSQNRKIAAALAKVNSTAQLKSLSSDLDNFIKLVGSSDDSSKLNTLFGQLRGKKELLSSLDKNYLEATTLVADIGKNSQPQTDLITQINTLSVDVAAINQLPKMNKTILSQANTKMDQKQLKNKTLSLRGIVNANRQFLAQKPNEPLRSLWFEEGSIVFKTLISNPSKIISQKVPLKYYLPKEVTRENITKTDEELTINYDTEKDQYYVKGNFTLDPGETKTIAVTVDDSAFYINDAEIATMRKQAEELSKPLNNTAYFAQGVTLKTDIDASLDKVDSLQKTNTTPEARIRSYRESIIEFKAAKEKLEKLKELATNAGSVGTLFGFVGGAQALAVWGLIIIMAAGFVFLALYMRALRGSEKYSIPNKLSPIDDGFENYEEIAQEENPPKKRFPFRRPIKYLAVILVSVLIGGSGVYGLWTMRQGQIKDQASPASQRGEQTPSQEVLGNSSENETQDTHKEVNILVPEDSMVTIQSQPSINSPVLTSLKASKRAKEITRQDIWVKVVLQDSEGKNIEGWVDGDFLDSDIKQKPQSAAWTSKKMVVINDTPTGFLRVRQTPGGEEITKVSPGEQYNMVKEQIGWVQIVLEDGTSGWVSKQYVSF